ncbi:tetratricopeptide repeat protein [Pontibacter sp. G13]|uniref:tetratricopeptide repeat protein n=1 Tax=Pontibacter sp. G13 TaxID=3074898 RepID=UPI00288C5F5C|nr:tetratricopeptide repeat protein [Pontibacter sp. G13]WNJ18066.1 tetratricopeptide repeat protein [Pontibacter sp. G13]
MKHAILYLIFASIWIVGCDSSESPSNSNSESPEAQTQATPADHIQALSLQISKNPKDYGLLEDRSRWYFEVDSMEKAMKDIEGAIALHPTGDQLYAWKGFLYYAQEDTATARSAYIESIRLGSKDPEVFYQLGQLDFFQKRYEYAKSGYEEAMKLDESDPQYPFALGFMKEEQGSEAKAVQWYVKALKVDSTFAKPLIRLHDLYLNFYENEQVAMDYNAQLLRSTPDHALGNYQKGGFHLRKAKELLGTPENPRFGFHLNEAVTAFTISVNSDPNFVDAWYSRGRVYFFGQTRIDEAVSDFEQTLTLNPKHAQAHFMLGSIYERNGDLKTALSYYSEAVAHNPDSKDFQRAVKEVTAQLK